MYRHQQLIHKHTLTVQSYGDKICFPKEVTQRYLNVIPQKKIHT